MRFRLLLCLAVSAVLSSCGSEAPVSDLTSAPSTENATTVAPSSLAAAPAGSAQGDYDLVLSEVGVVVSDAPSAAVVLADAVFCGWDQIGPIAGGNSRVDLAGRKCFVQAHLDGRSAVFLVDARTNEGDPTPFIYRTDGGHVTEFANFTRDNYGTREWRVGPCDSFYIATYDSESPARLVFSCYPWDETGQL
ncbi:MAG: hypothetical protein ABMA25_04080 [Ilumatobacteraceae bacterium]